MLTAALGIWDALADFPVARGSQTFARHPVKGEGEMARAGVPIAEFVLDRLPAFGVGRVVERNPELLADRLAIVATAGETDEDQDGGHGRQAGEKEPH